MIKYFDMRNF